MQKLKKAVRNQFNKQFSRIQREDEFFCKFKTDSYNKSTLLNENIKLFSFGNVEFQIFYYN